ncbi:MAG: permease-like cell division protein FtsX [Thiobacillus sp.]
MIGWLRHQKRALTTALRRLAHQPIATLLTALAMGVAISLPSGLYLVLAQVSQLASSLPAQPEISLFLAPEASPGDKHALAARLKQADIAHARFVDKNIALARLAKAQRLEDVTAGLSNNPLPDAWIVRPADTSRSALQDLHKQLAKHPGVAESQLDSAWADRLQAGLQVGHNLVWLLAGLFAIALVAISGNAIRAQVLARRDEIQISRLIGATDRHIRRPFLYLGAAQGLLGGLAACGVVALAGWALNAPVTRLAALYGSSFQLAPPSLLEVLAVLAFTTAFGWLGSWIAVSRTLAKVESGQ